MKTLLICPSESGASAFFSCRAPLPLCPWLGRSVLDRKLAELSALGATYVVILTPDRPAQIRAAAGDGRQWGLAGVEVIACQDTWSVEAARAAHVVDGSGWLQQPYDVTLLQTPQAGGVDVSWKNSSKWFVALIAGIEHAGREVVGMRELSPRIWVGTKARIAPTAKLFAPCWVGQNAVIGHDAIIGPDTVIERRAFVDEGAEVRRSFVGPSTYVGSFLRLHDSLAWARHLLNWRSDSFVEIADAFLLSDLKRGFLEKNSSLFGSFMALLVMVLSAPLVLPVAALMARHRGQALFKTRRAVSMPVKGDVSFARTIHWNNLNGVGDFLGRWPELWKIVKGEFAWVGNRPLSPDKARSFDTDFERLWLSVPCGLFSLSDAEGCKDFFNDDARAHSAFYAVQRTWKSDLSILARCLKRFFRSFALRDIFPQKVKSLQQYNSTPS